MEAHHQDLGVGVCTSEEYNCVAMTTLVVPVPVTY